MTSFNEFADSMEKLGKKLYEQGKRTASVARLKIELSTLDHKRREILIDLGDRFFQMYKQDKIKDRSILEPLEDMTDKLSDIENKITVILREIEEIALEIETENDEEMNPKNEPEAKDSAAGTKNSKENTVKPGE
jgi:seryl-tRNA synthetase